MNNSGYTVNELARESCVSFASIYRFLRGDIPTKRTSAKLSKALGVRNSWLLTGEDESLENAADIAHNKQVLITRQSEKEQKRLSEEHGKLLRKYDREADKCAKILDDEVNTLPFMETIGKGYGTLYANSTLEAVLESMQDRGKSLDETKAALARASRCFQTRQTEEPADDYNDW